ncbi:hypothetical protein [Streptomyces malaysiensis]|uniref:hypothetical protein n=1 Tax=Streptomyces malaysiensis TaxID=92644 RepID=UPI000853031D|nr:hypothetical protein [Streptomyces sp. SPMA113]
MTDLYENGAAEANKTRAYWALTALKAFGRETGQDDYFDGTLNVDAEALLEVSEDLLTAVFHLARLNHVDPEQITSAAYGHFEEEVKEEEETTAD